MQPVDIDDLQRKPDATAETSYPDSGTGFAARERQALRLPTIHFDQQRNEREGFGCFCPLEKASEALSKIPLRV